MLEVLTPIWESKTETATRVRQRIKKVLDYATEKNYRSGVNPALWRGVLEPLLSKPEKLKKVIHHPALPVDRMQPFVALLGEKSDLTAHALQLLILTTARSRSIRYMQWEDIDLANEVWTVPREYLKRKQGSLTYPLSGLAEQIL